MKLLASVALAWSLASAASAQAEANGPTAAPVNLAPNSQWEIWSGVSYGTAMTPSAGAGATRSVETAIAASGNTTLSDAAFQGAISGRTLRVASVASGAPAVGQTVASATSNVDGAGIAQVVPDTKIVSGSGGVWTLSNASNTISGQPLYACAACGYTTFTVAGTGDLSVGDLVTVSGAGVDRSLTLAPMRVTAIPDGSHITVRVPRGLTPTVSAPSRITPIQIGAQWYATHGTGDGPDGWTRYPVSSSAGPILWRDFLRGPYAVNRPSSVTPYAALGVQIRQSDSYVGINMPGGSSAVTLANYQGKTVVFGAYVMQKVRSGAGAWNITANIDGVGVKNCSPAPPDLGRYQWMECAFDVPPRAKYVDIGIHFAGNPGDVYFIVDPVLAIGSYIGGVKNYQKPKNELFVPLVHIAADPFWINQTIKFPDNQQQCGAAYASFCFVFDPYAETGGAIAPTVLKAHGQLEGFDDGPVVKDSGYTRVMAFFDQAAAPEKSGSFMGQHVSGVKEYAYMDFPFLQNTAPDWLGTEFVGTNIAGDVWRNVSIEMDDFVLQ